MPSRYVPDPTQIKIDGKAATRTHVSTNIVITVNGRSIGAVTSFNINESRTLKAVDEIGTDGHIDLLPTSSTNISGSCDRIRFGGKRLAEAFSRGFVHLKSQRVPFDIVIFDHIRGLDANQVVTTVIENVWFDKLDAKYSASDFIISDNAGFQAESIYSYTNGGDSAILDPSDAFLNQFERDADTGLYRGALDGAGLIYAFEGTRGVISTL